MKSSGYFQAMGAWYEQTNVYEVNLRQYTDAGTIKAFESHLPRLKDMGVQTLWFMPITPIAQKNKKGSLGSYYACSDYTSVSPEFGSLQDWKSLVEKAHSLGFKIILDWVANHTGWDHKWTVEHPGWYKKDEATADFKKASGMDDIIELDFNNPEVRKAMIEAMAFWVKDTGIDGFRCDLAFWVQLDFWIEAKAALDSIKPLFWLGELDPLDNPEYMQVFNAAYTWRWMHAAQHFYHDHHSLNELHNVLTHYDDAPGIKTWFTSNHDENSWNGTEYEKYGDMAKALAVFSCTWAGIPLIYSGQELPNQKRLQFFEKDPIQWSEPMQLHSFYKKLLELQLSSPALHSSVEVSVLNTDKDEKVLAFIRTSSGSQVVVFLNLSGEQLKVEVDYPFASQYNHLFTNENFASYEMMSPVLSPWSFDVYTNKL